MNWRFSMVLGIILGILLTIGITALIVCIGSSINGVTFAQQICDWFGKTPTKETAAAVIGTLTRIKI